MGSLQTAHQHFNRLFTSFGTITLFTSFGTITVIFGTMLTMTVCRYKGNFNL
jgi:hypothetical protein